MIGTTQKLRAATPSLGTQAYAEFLRMVLCDIWAYQNMAGKGPAIRPLLLSFEQPQKRVAPMKKDTAFAHGAPEFALASSTRSHAHGFFFFPKAHQRNSC